MKKSIMITLMALCLGLASTTVSARSLMHTVVMLGDIGFGITIGPHYDGGNYGFHHHHHHYRYDYAPIDDYYGYPNYGYFYPDSGIYYYKEGGHWHGGHHHH